MQPRLRSQTIPRTLLLLVSLIVLAPWLMHGQAQAADERGRQETFDTVFDLNALVDLTQILSAPTGSTATYWVDQRVEIEQIHRAGIFRALPLAVLTESLPLIDQSAWVRFEVLAPSPEGDARFGVLLLPADPESRELRTDQPPWTGIYRAEEGSFTLETSVPPPTESLTFVHPSALEYNATAESIPPGLVPPGTIWFSAPIVMEPDGEREEWSGIIESSFVGWERISGATEPAARVSERFDIVSPAHESEELEGLLTMTMKGESDFWFRPGGFPLKIQSAFDIAVITESLHGELSVEASVQVLVEQVDKGIEAILAASGLGRLEGDALRLQPRQTLPIGATASYILREEFQIEPLERTGEFLIVHEDEFRAEVVTAAYVELTVLEPILPETIRIRALSIPVDAESGLRLILEPTWEGIYTISTIGEVFLDGDEPPEEYYNLMAPFWLLWGLNELTSPPDAIRPGDRWTIDDPDLNALLLEEGVYTDTSFEFIGWVQTEWSTEEWALIRESSTSGTTEPLFEDGLLFTSTVETTTLTWERPLHLPLAGEFNVRGETTVSSLTGDLLFLQKERTTAHPAERHTVDVSTPLAIGLVVDGAFDANDRVLFDGTYIDVYSVSGDAGERLQVRMRSADIDAFLFVLDEEWEFLSSDDDSLGGTDALLEVELPQTGTYYIVANTWSPSEGAYTLQAVLLPPVDLAD